MNTREFICLGAMVVLAAPGCTTNVYTTPRTVPARKAHHAVVVAINLKTPRNLRSSFPAIAYAMRLGIADRVDIGFGASTVVKIDLKYNPIRTRYFDLSVDPTISGGLELAFPAKETLGFQASLPIIMGLNLHQRFSIVGYGGGYVSVPSGTPTQMGPLAGGGFQIRIADRFTLQPEINVQWLDSGESAMSAGIGFGFGRQPRYWPMR